MKVSRLWFVLALVTLAVGPATADTAKPAAADAGASPFPVTSSAAHGPAAPQSPEPPVSGPRPGATAAPSSASSPAPSAGPAATPAPLSGPQVGAPAPTFSLHTLDGKTLALENFKGKTLVINAWATWCPPCREEMPSLIAAAHKMAKGDVVLLGVDTTEAAPIVRAYAIAKSVPYPLAVTTDDAFAKAYDVAYFPTTFVIDPQGVLRARYVDVVTTAQLADFVQTAKAGRNVEIASPLQRKIDATLADASLVYSDDPRSVEANAKKAAAKIDDAETLIDRSDGGNDNEIDFVRTRAEEAALRDRTIAALVNVGTSIGDKTLLTRLQGDAAVDREQWRDAAQAYQAVLAIAPNDAAALSGLSISASRLGDRGLVVDTDSKLSALDPSDVPSLVGLARAQADAGKQNDANATFVKAIAAAQRRLAADPRKPVNTRMLAYAHLYSGRNAAKSGDRAEARAQFDAVSKLAAKLPANDARHDMYLEEAQEAIVALGLSAQNGLSVSLAPWTGPELPGSLASTLKYRLAVAGDAGRTVSLVAQSLPKHWIASFCTDSVCAPFKTSFALPPSGVKLVEFQLIPPDARAATPTVRVTGNDGKNDASATT